MTVSAQSKTKPKRLRIAIRNLVSALAILLLSLTLILQTVLLFRSSLPVPGFITNQLQNELHSRGLSAEFSSFEFFPPATVAATEISISRFGETDPFATAGAAQIRANFLDLLTGNFSLENLQISDAEIFAPAALSPDGSQTRLAHGIQIHGSQQNNTWQIDRITGQIRNLQFAATGQIPPFPKPEDREPTDLTETLATVLPQIVQQLENLDRAQNPFLHLTFGPAENTFFQIAADLRADQISLPKEILLERPRFSGTLNFDGENWTAHDVSLQIAHASHPFHQIDASRIRTTFHWNKPFDSENPLPARAEIFAHEIRSDLLQLHALSAQAKPTGESTVALDLFSLFSDGTFRAEIAADWKLGNASAKTRLHANPNPVLQNPLLKELGFKRDVFFHKTPYLHATAEIRDWNQFSAQGRALSGPLEIDGVFLDRAWARAGVENTRFIVSEMILAFEDFEASGSYDVDMFDHDYRLFFSGSFRPLHISGWFQEWWPNFWNEFAFPETPMRGDVDIHGVLGASDEVRVEGIVEAENLFLRGVPFDSVSGNLLVDGNYLDLYNLRLVRPEGSAQGEFQLWQNRDTGQFDRIDLAAESTLDLFDAAAIFGELGTEIVSPFRFETAPEIQMHGSIFGGDRKDETRLTVTGKSTDPLVYHGLPLDSLKFDLLIEGNEWKLENLAAKIAEGDVVGSARKWTEADNERLALDLRLVWLDLAQATTILSEWQSANSGQPNELDLENRFSGRVTLDLNATGDYGDFQSFSGDGNFRIREADLAELHLLGLLSRALRSTPLRFTSLHFSEADSVFRVEPGKVHFSDLRLSGPGSALHASGDYLMADETLDFSLKLFFLQESPIPFLSTILSPVLNPLAHVTEIRLTGPAGAPNWRFLLGPSNLLQGITDLKMTDDPPEKSPK